MLPPCDNLDTVYFLLAYGVLWPYIGFNREALSRLVAYFIFCSYDSHLRLCAL